MWAAWGGAPVAKWERGLCRGGEVPGARPQSPARPAPPTRQPPATRGSSPSNLNELKLNVSLCGEKQEGAACFHQPCHWQAGPQSSGQGMARGPESEGKGGGGNQSFEAGGTADWGASAGAGFGSLVLATETGWRGTQLIPDSATRPRGTGEPHPVRLEDGQQGIDRAPHF